MVAAFTPCFGHLCHLCHHGHFGHFGEFGVVRVVTKCTPIITATATITVTVTITITFTITITTYTGPITATATITATTNTTIDIVVVATTTAVERTLVPVLLQLLWPPRRAVSVTAQRFTHVTVVTQLFPTTLATPSDTLATLATLATPATIALRTVSRLCCVSRPSNPLFAKKTVTVAGTWRT